MVNIVTLINAFYECIGWPYATPGSTNKDASSGIDCSGMFVRAFKLQGATIEHGSNYIWRYRLTSNKGPISSVNDLFVGAAVFKWNPNTPPKYKDGLGDFQHIGLVTSVNPLKIVHASSEFDKVVEDTKLGKWKYVGQLANVDYSGISIPALQMLENNNMEVLPMNKIGIVYAATGDTVNMRSSMSQKSDRLAKVQVGEKVEVITEVGLWAKIKYKNLTGYMMKEFIHDEGDVVNDIGTGDMSLEERVNYLEQALITLNAKVDELFGGVG